MCLWFSFQSPTMFLWNQQMKDACQHSAEKPQALVQWEHSPPVSLLSQGAKLNKFSAFHFLSPIYPLSNKSLSETITKSDKWI